MLPSTLLQCHVRQRFSLMNSATIRVKIGTGMKERYCYKPSTLSSIYSIFTSDSIIFSTTASSKSNKNVTEKNIFAKDNEGLRPMLNGHRNLKKEAVDLPVPVTAQGIAIPYYY